MKVHPESKHEEYLQSVYVSLGRSRLWIWCASLNAVVCY